MTDTEHWVRYYEVTVERPAWGTVRLAIERFAEEKRAHGAERFAVDMGCGAGRDTRELLRAGWRVLAIDREPAAIASLEAAVEPELRPRLQTLVADVATVKISDCDLVNASVSLPYLTGGTFWPTWNRALAALPIGGRVSAMLFGDRDEGASDPEMTCVSPDDLLTTLGDFDIEHWVDIEEDSHTALGDPHHFHRLEVVARRVR